MLQPLMCNIICRRDKSLHFWIFSFIIQLLHPFLKFFCFSIIIVPILPPLLYPGIPIPSSHFQFYTLPPCLCPCFLYTYSLMNLPFFSVITHLPPPLWSLSVCSSFECLWFYFAHLFVLLIRFHF